MADSITGVGFIGLGVMGSRMARRLVDAGYRVHAYDLKPEAVDVLVRAGAHAATSCTDVGNKARVVFCSLGMPEHVHDAVLGATGIAKGSTVRVIVDLSSTGAVMEQKIAASLKGTGISLVDSPVSGGSHGAEAGTLTLMCAGPRAAFEEAEPMLKNIGKNIFWLSDDTGRGQTMKMINNMVAAASTIASFEAMVLGVKAGLDPQTMCDVLNVSGGVTVGSLHKIPKCVLPRTFPNLFSTDLMYKDVRLGAEEAESLGVPLWVIESAKNFLKFAISQGDGPIDWANGIKHFENWAGVTVGKGNKEEGNT